MSWWHKKERGCKSLKSLDDLTLHSLDIRCDPAYGSNQGYGIFVTGTGQFDDCDYKKCFTIHTAKSLKGDKVWLYSHPMTFEGLYNKFGDKLFDKMHEFADKAIDEIREECIRHNDCVTALQPLLKRHRNCQKSKMICEACQGIRRKCFPELDNPSVCYYCDRYKERREESSKTKFSYPTKPCLLKDLECLVDKYK